jgi:hypothetical protein
MPSFGSVGRAIANRQNWPVFGAAGALVFLGSQLLKSLALDSAGGIMALIVLITIVANPYFQTSTEDLL